MAKRRSRGEGSIYFWEEKNLWVAKLTLPDGKRKTKYGKTQKEVRTWLLEKRKALKDGVFIEDERITVEQFLRRYLSDYASKHLRPSTHASYTHNIENHIIPEIGHIRLSQLRAVHLHALYDKKREELAPKTVHYLHGIIHRALNKAVKWGVLNVNPASKAETPTYTKPEMKTWTGEESKRFLASLSNDRWWAIYVLACGTGMREGEILGLKWENVNLENGYLKVIWSLQYIKGKGLKLLEPKSDKSKRMLVLPEFVIESLKIHRIRQDRLREGNDWKEHGFVFTTNIGTPISPRNLIRHFKSKIIKAEVPEIRFHDLRHTVASLLLPTTHPKVVQELLGHSSIILTLDTYSHLIPSLKKDAADSLDDIFK